MVDCFCAPPDRAGEYWAAVGDVLIKPAFDNSLTDYETIANAVMAGDMLLWLAWDGTEIYAACVTQLGTSNGRRFCLIVAVGGRDMSRWLYLVNRLEQYAKDEGCQSIALIGRRGWERELPEYKVKRVTLEKELTYG